MLFECADLAEIRRKKISKKNPQLYSLFRNVIPERIFDFLKKIGVFYKTWGVFWIHEFHHQPWKKTVYRPPPSKKNRLTSMTFHGEFAVLVSEISATNKNILMSGDFNFHFDKQETSDTKRLSELLTSTGLSQSQSTSTPTGSHPGLGDHNRISSGPNPFHWCWRSPPLRSFPRDNYYKYVKTKTVEVGGKVQTQKVWIVMPFVVTLASPHWFSHLHLV